MRKQVQSYCNNLEASLVPAGLVLVVKITVKLPRSRNPNRNTQKLWALDRSLAREQEQSERAKGLAQAELERIEEERWKYESCVEAGQQYADTVMRDFDDAADAGDHVMMRRCIEEYKCVEDVLVKREAELRRFNLTHPRTNAVRAGLRANPPGGPLQRRIVHIGRSSKPRSSNDRNQHHTIEKQPSQPAVTSQMGETRTRPVLKRQPPSRFQRSRPTPPVVSGFPSQQQIEQHALAFASQKLDEKIAHDRILAQQGKLKPSSPYRGDPKVAAMLKRKIELVDFQFEAPKILNNPAITGQEKNTWIAAMQRKLWPQLFDPAPAAAKQDNTPDAEDTLNDTRSWIEDVTTSVTSTIGLFARNVWHFTKSTLRF